MGFMGFFFAVSMRRTLGTCFPSSCANSKLDLYQFFIERLDVILFPSRLSSFQHKEIDCSTLEPSASWFMWGTKYLS